MIDKFKAIVTSVETNIRDKYEFLYLSANSFFKLYFLVNKCKYTSIIIGVK